MIQYTYNGKIYTSFFQLKKKTPNLIFSQDTPKELLETIGITIEEIPDPVTEVDPLVAAKEQRDNDVKQITVEVDGMIFDGNEKAQDRISRTILGWDENTDGIEWVLANNEIAFVTKEQLQRVLQLATAEMQRLWVLPYTSQDIEQDDSEVQPE